MKENSREDLWQDFLAVCEKYDMLLPAHEISYLLIEASVKMLMDIAPRHGIALETIKTATEEGIKWHVEERSNGKI